MSLAQTAQEQAGPVANGLSDKQLLDATLKARQEAVARDAARDKAKLAKSEPAKSKPLISGGLFVGIWLITCAVLWALDAPFWSLVAAGLGVGLIVAGINERYARSKSDGKD